jgi:hypothetical protein
MQKRSHRLLASTLLSECDGFDKKRFEKAFLFGSFQPDCNPLSYCKGSLRGRAFLGHNFSNSQPYIDRHIHSLQRRSRWTVWQYYTLGKLTHYLADAFTYPHNDTYHEGVAAHRRYENALRLQFARYLREGGACPAPRCDDVTGDLAALHQRYLAAASDGRRDCRYILLATAMLMASVRPQGAAAGA